MHKIEERSNQNINHWFKMNNLKALNKYLFYNDKFKF